MVLFGKKIYTINYKCDLGRDPLRKIDEMYFDLIETDKGFQAKNVQAIRQVV